MKDYRAHHQNLLKKTWKQVRTVQVTMVLLFRIHASVSKRHTAVTKMSYSVEGVLSSWSETTDYGQSFRAMNEEGQRGEVENLNKGAAKGMKGIIKNKLLIVHYKQLVADKMRQYLSDSKVSQESMFHTTPKAGTMSIANLKFLSVCEWVEVDADRTPGFNSEGGIAVIVNVHDDLADVKYVLTRRVEKLVPLRRLTTDAASWCSCFPSNCQESSSRN